MLPLVWITLLKRKCFRLSQLPTSVEVLVVSNSEKAYSCMWVKNEAVCQLLG